MNNLSVVNLFLKGSCYDLFIYSSSTFLSVYSEPGLLMDTEDPAVKVMFPVGRVRGSGGREVGITSSE